MAGVKGKSGGPRPATRPDDGRLGKLPEHKKASYVRLPVLEPDDAISGYAIKWWRSLTPEQRLEVVCEAFEIDEGRTGSNYFDAWLDEKIPDSEIAPTSR